MNEKLITIGEARSISVLQGKEIPTRTIRYACKMGFIRGAQKKGRDWLLTMEGFDHWVNHRPKPGKKRQ